MSRAIGGSGWSDSEANAAIAASGYSGLVLLDRVTLYNAGTGYVETRYWNGASWLTFAALINGNLLVNGSVGAAKLNVSQLSAISGVIGLLRTATSGARLELESNQVRVYDANNVLRVRMGIW
ncbi:MAG TPA: hypothetical protein VFL86_11250 [Burkholderiaceae bacterium]|nr:hypothetical protein [Burkholderiaceae bacterium]